MGVAEPHASQDGAASSGSGSGLQGRLGHSLSSFAEVFRHRDLRHLSLALGLNWTADNAYLVALLIYAYEAGGATAVGLVGLIRTVPAGVAGLFGAVVADRYRRERLLRALYAGRALVAALTAVAFFASMPVAVVFVLAAVLNALAVLLRPAYWALLPGLARTSEQLVACNAAAGILEGLAWLVGPAIAGAIVGLSSAGVVFGVTAGVFLAAAALSALVSAAQVVVNAPAERRVLAETLAGVGEVIRNRDARLIFGLFGSQTAVRGALSVLVVVAALELLGMGEAGVGWLNSAFGVGGLAGAIASLSLVARRRLALPFGIGLILWGAPIALVGIWPNPAVALILLGIPGLGNAVLDVAGFTMLQRTIPDRLLGRVFGAFEAQVFATMGAGSVLASGLIAWLGVRGALVVTGASLPALAALAWRRLRSIDDRTAVPERELAVLRRVGMFAPLPAVALEHLAANLVPVEAPARTRICRQGEPGDRLYVIVRGEVNVRAGGRMTARLGPGDHFGEIALLHGVPRTASITARTDVELYAIDSEPFLAAVSGNTLSADEAKRIADARLSAARTPKRRTAARRSAARDPKRRTAARTRHRS